MASISRSQLQKCHLTFPVVKFFPLNAPSSKRNTVIIFILIPNYRCPIHESLVGSVPNLILNSKGKGDSLNHNTNSAYYGLIVPSLSFIYW